MLRLCGVSVLEENGEGTDSTSDGVVRGGGDGMFGLVIGVKGTRYEE